MLALLCDRALGSNRVAVCIVHSNGNLVCTVIADKSVYAYCKCALAIINSTCDNGSRNACPVSSLGLFNSTAGGNGNLYLEVVVTACGRAKVVLTCLGDLEGGNIKFVLYRRILTGLDYRAACAKELKSTTVATGYPPYLNGSSSRCSR